MSFLIRSLNQRILLPLVTVLALALTLIAIEHTRSFQKEFTNLRPPLARCPAHTAASAPHPTPQRLHS